MCFGCNVFFVLALPLSANGVVIESQVHNLYSFVRHVNDFDTTEKAENLQFQVTWSDNTILFKPTHEKRLVSDLFLGSPSALVLE